MSFFAFLDVVLVVVIMCVYVCEGCVMVEVCTSIHVYYYFIYLCCVCASLVCEGLVMVEVCTSIHDYFVLIIICVFVRGLCCAEFVLAEGLFLNIIMIIVINIVKYV